MPYAKYSRRTRNLFDPASKAPFRLSRSRLENFMNCQRCFYLDRRLGVDTPRIPAFTLNSAVDSLLKKEFDLYRTKKETHPIMKQHKIDAVPFAHPMIDEWRENFKGVQYHHKPTNLIITGAVDDIWADRNGMLYVVDYKSTSTSEQITLDSEYRQSFKRQMEIYQWLLRKSEFRVSDTGYFLFCNADKSREVFDSVLQFKTEIISYKGKSDWVEQTIIEAYKCLKSDWIPVASQNCEYCGYRKAAQQLERTEPKQKSSKPKLQRELFA